jgi:hypothetical protein
MSDVIYVEGINISNRTVNRYIPNIFRYYDKSVYGSYESAISAGDPVLVSELLSGNIKFFKISEVLEILVDTQNPDNILLRNQMIHFALQCEKSFNNFNLQKSTCGGKLIPWFAYFNLSLDPFVPSLNIPILASTVNVTSYDLASFYRVSNTFTVPKNNINIGGYLELFNFITNKKKGKNIDLIGSDFIYLSFATLESLYQVCKMIIQAKCVALPSPYNIIFTPTLAKQIYNFYNPLIINRANAMGANIVGNNMQF